MAVGIARMLFVTLLALTAMALWGGAVSPKDLTPGPGSGYVGIGIDSDNGAFVMGVPGGYGLQYGWPSDTGDNYTTFQIDGMNVYDNKYSDQWGDVITAPATTGGTNEGIWRIGTTSLRVHQIITLVNGTNSGALDTYLIQYVVENNDAVAHNVGCRILIQWAPGGMDRTFMIPGYPASVTTEQQWATAQIPGFITAFNETWLISQNMQGNYTGRAVTLPPDQVILGSRALYDAIFNYTINSATVIDWGYTAPFWYDKAVPAGGSITFSTYCGLGNLSADPDDPLTVVTGPRFIECANGAYSPNPYPYLLYTSSVYGDVYTGVTASLTLPAGLALASGSATQSLPDLHDYNDHLATWMVSATGSATGALDYSIGLTANELTPPVSLSRSVTVPGTCACTTIQMLSVDGSSCPAIKANVRVLDGLGQPVTGLVANAFTLKEDSVTQAITVVPASAAGNYVVSYNTTYTGGSSHGIAVTVTYQGCTPSASGTAQCTCGVTCTATVPTGAGAGQSVSFNASASTTCPGALAYAWQFGDGATSASQNATHTFTSNGTYTWTLTVSVGSAVCTKTGTITISTPLTVSASPDKTSGPAPLTVTWTYTASGGTPPYTASWNFGDGSTGSGSPASHTYSTIGTYTWTLAVTDSAGAGGSATGTITVTNPVAPPAIASISKMGAPFRIKVMGSNLQNGVTVTINGAPWTNVTWKSTGKLLLGSGASLKAAVPKGVNTTFVFRNPDGGTATSTWHW